MNSTMQRNYAEGKLDSLSPDPHKLRDDEFVHTTNGKMKLLRLALVEVGWAAPNVSSTLRFNVKPSPLNGRRRSTCRRPWTVLATSFREDLCA